ncbi:uncharacterized protein C8R40DRAFT_1168455 [Lentinula edodes]|uniref:uncharacterized protein n=1 Tax=Lentinula edodes TaxID=5353 RepID=UPI001E8E8AE0|nr:uncharacterized protein C8R40DRAFT_1168455 [Lentinula edodes]KAH7877748.1 hypothetical protein C8R40DRAFT_1168455 [Lentinula edodes]
MPPRDISSEAFVNSITGKVSCKTCREAYPHNDITWTTRTNFTGAHQKSRIHSQAIEELKRRRLVDIEQSRNLTQLFSSSSVALKNSIIKPPHHSSPSASVDINGLGPDDMCMSSEDIEHYFSAPSVVTEEVQDELLAKELAALRMSTLEEVYLDSSNDATVPSVINEFQSIGI